LFAKIPVFGIITQRDLAVACKDNHQIKFSTAVVFDDGYFLHQEHAFGREKLRCLMFPAAFFSAMVFGDGYFPLKEETCGSSPTVPD
jgi:hypothetical protein